MNIVIAGASGFIGSELMKEIPQAKGISRNDPKSDRWIQADLFSRSLCERALVDCDIAFYLVHSMLPTSHLDQGNFEDFDLIIADNFARACRINKVKQIIYLAGIIPSEKELSKHLKSRKEVESILKSSGVPVTTLRAGLIIGAKGSSFSILKNLSLQIPFLAYPKWLLSEMEPVSVKKVIESLKHCVNNEETFNQTYDLTNCERISYKDLILLTRKLLNKNTIAFPFYVPPFLIKFWFRIFSRAPKNLVFPLLESLRHNMTSRPHKRLNISYKDETIKELVKSELNKGDRTPQAFKERPNNKVVRSIQRINVKCEENTKVYQLYFDWLTKFFHPFMKVETDGDHCSFKFLGLPLLQLTHMITNSEPKRELLSISGGLLVSKNQKYGRLEFRKFSDCIIVAIHDFMPSMPWYIYIFSQAIVHKFVMICFSKHLQRTGVCSKKN